MLTAEQVAAYRNDGYLRVSSIFTAEELEELEREMDGIVEEWWGEDSIAGRGRGAIITCPPVSRRTRARCSSAIHTSTRRPGGGSSFTSG